MKLTVVGHWGAYPEAGEATSGYLVEHNGFKLLVDCGSGVLSQLQHYCKLEELNAVIISHYHHDHIADVGPLQYSMDIGRALKKVTQPLPIYGHGLDQEEFGRLAKPPNTVAYMYSEKETTKIGPFSISFMRTNHKAICFAMRIEVDGEVLVYSADSSYKEEFNEFAKNADVFICETNFYAGQDGKPFGHMNSHDAASIAKAANVKTLLLTHLPHFGNTADLVEEAKSIFSGKVLLAEKGLTIGGESLHKM